MMVKLFTLRDQGDSSCRRWVFELLVAGIWGLIAIPVGAQTRPAASPFTLASLEGNYAYANSLSNVASYGVFHFDGRGGLSVDSLHVNKSCPSCEEGNREIAELKSGTGSYEMHADGTGILTVSYAETAPSVKHEFTYEFVVTSAVELAGGKRLATGLFSAGTTGGLDGQLFAPTFTRQVVPISNSNAR